MTAHRPSAVRRREIADAALSVFGESGLASLTTAAIAKKVGVTDAALFRHFDSKHEVIAAAIDRAGEILFEGFPPTCADPSSDSASSSARASAPSARPQASLG